MKPSNPKRCLSLLCTPSWPLAIGLLVLTAPVISSAQAGLGPEWWTSSETRIWSGGGETGENAAPINAGQLKHVASRAAAYLDLRLAPAGGAGPEITALIDGFQNLENYTPVNVGQLKHVSSLFYRRLAEVHFPVREGLLAVGVPPHHLDAQTGNPVLYPWNTEAPASENATPANIGQLKVVFSFEVDHWITVDADDNGNPDWLDDLGIGNPIPVNRDSDGDGITDLAEIALGRDPRENEFAEKQRQAESRSTGLRVFTPVPSNP